MGNDQFVAGRGRRHFVEPFSLFCRLSCGLLSRSGHYSYCGTLRKQRVAAFVGTVPLITVETLVSMTFVETVRREKTHLKPDLAMKPTAG